MTRAFDLAQLNVGRPLGPIDSEIMAEFVAGLDPINALAEASPGFVWRLQTEEGNASAIRGADVAIMVNMSTWESMETLADFAYRSAHAAYMRRRRNWFEKMEIYMVLWWVPAGHRPTVPEAEARLALLAAEGPTENAFTFRQPFPPPGGGDVAVRGDDACTVV
jgi:Domain of unknown function (DUF3291)